MGRFFIPTTSNGPSFASSFPPILHRQDTANPSRCCAMNSKPAQLSPSLPLRKVKAIVRAVRTPVQDVSNSSALGHDARTGCTLRRKPIRKPSSRLAPRRPLSQFFSKEIDTRVISPHPVPPYQKIMNLIGENYLFEINLLLTQPLCQIDCLAEWHVTIIIAMNQQNRRFPGSHAGVRRRLKGKFFGFFLIGSARTLFPVGQEYRPIMHAVHVDARRKNIRVARQSQRREQATIRSAPQPDPLCIDNRQALQVFRAGDNVFVFRRSSPPRVRRFPESAAIHDSETVIDRKYDVSPARQVLIHGIRIVVVVHVMKTEHHLANRAAMDKNQRWSGLSPFRRDEKLAMDF